MTEQVNRKDWMTAPTYLRPPVIAVMEAQAEHLDAVLEYVRGLIRRDDTICATAKQRADATYGRVLLRLSELPIADDTAPWVDNVVRTTTTFLGWVSIRRAPPPKKAEEQHALYELRSSIIKARSEVEVSLEEWRNPSPVPADDPSTEGPEVA